jgi:putative hydrolase of the HAD superfamily
MSEMGVKTTMIRAVFFDLYCTLIDIRTDENDIDVYSALARYLKYHGVTIAPEDLRATFFAFVERSLRKSNERYAEVDVYHIFGDIMQRYGVGPYTRQIVVDTAMLFRSLTIRRFGLFPQVIETLASLKEKYHIGLISDAQWVFTEPELRMLGLDHLFEVILLSSRFGYKKPDARLFREALRRIGVSAEESVYIGDNPPKDMVGAKSTGMKFILFQSEWCSCEGFTPDAWLGQYADLPGIIAQFDLTDAS